MTRPLRQYAPFIGFPKQQSGKHMQFLESRRFLENEVERQLNKYGLGMIASQRFDNYGLYLCGKA
jgi:hypothetical protein